MEINLVQKIRPQQMELLHRKNATKFMSLDSVFAHFKSGKKKRREVKHFGLFVAVIVVAVVLLLLTFFAEVSQKFIIY